MPIQSFHERNRKIQESFHDNLGESTLNTIKHDGNHKTIKHIPSERRMEKEEENEEGWDREEEGVGGE